MARESVTGCRGDDRCLGHPAAVHAQLTAEEYKVFDKLLAEPDGKAATAKRLAMIAEGWSATATTSAGKA